MTSGCANAPDNRTTESIDALQSRLVGTAANITRPPELLRDDHGTQFSIASRPADELTVVFFGYTHCPDFCPTTAADLAAARTMVPPDIAAHVQVVFITEDPARDTPRAVRRWLARFDPTFIGLIGGNATSAQIIKQLYSVQTEKVAAPKKPIHHPEVTRNRDDHETYGIGHTSVVYAFAPDGRSVIYSGGASPQDYAADFLTLLGDT